MNHELSENNEKKEESCRYKLRMLQLQVMKLKSQVQPFSFMKYQRGEFGKILERIRQFTCILLVPMT